MQVFPLNNGGEDRNNQKMFIARNILGHRFHKDQNMMEYLIEFLLIFTSEKNNDKNDGKMKFHDSDDKKLQYTFDPKMGLRRFIFYDKTNKKDSVKLDENAYNELMDILAQRMDSIESKKKEEYLAGIQDLFHGYACVVKNRYWGAQALLPICPEFVLCESNPSTNARLELQNKIENINSDTDEKTISKLCIDIEKKFDCNRHNYLARGGEIYYLHLLQGLKGHSDKKELLEKLLTNMLTDGTKKISNMARFIQNTWLEEKEIDPKTLAVTLSMGYIPIDAYVKCEENSINELINYLSNNIHPVMRVEILAQGIMLQVMRMMTYAISERLHKKNEPWIIDMCATDNDVVKKISENSFRRIEEDFLSAISLEADALYENKPLAKDINDAKDRSITIFRGKGKEIGVVIPFTGASERFSLSEDIIRFLILSCLAPGEKLTFDMFLERLYQHYNMVIGPIQYRKLVELNIGLEANYINNFTNNMDAFSTFLKNAGFLRELSDATSIVYNPYSKVEV